MTVEMDAAKTLFKNFVSGSGKWDTDSFSGDNRKSTEGGEGSGEANPATLAAQRATERRNERQIGSQSASRMTTAQSRIDSATDPPVGNGRRAPPLEKLRPTDQKPACTKRSLVIESSEKEFSDRGSELVDSTNNRIEELEKYIAKLHESQNKRLGEMEAQMLQCEREKAEYRAKLIEVCKERDRIAEDNVTLRKVNVSMRSPHRQYPDDENYIQRIKTLNQSIKAWVKTAFKSSNHPELSVDEDAKVTQILHKRGQLEPLLSMLAPNSSLRPVYSNSPCRVALVRYLISLCLWTFIFHPVSPCLDSDEDRLMGSILQSILTKG